MTAYFYEAVRQNDTKQKKSNATFGVSGEVATFNKLFYLF